MWKRLSGLILGLVGIGFTGCCCGKRNCCPPAPYVPGGCSCNPATTPGPVPIGRPGPGAAPVMVPPPPAPVAPPPPPPAPPPTDVRPYEPSATEQGSYYWRPAEDNGARYEVPAENGVHCEPPADNGVRSDAPPESDGRYETPADNGARYEAPAEDRVRYSAPADNGGRYEAPAEGRVRYSAPAENGVRLGSPLPDKNISARIPPPPLPRLPREPEPPSVREDRKMPQSPEPPADREDRQPPPPPEKPIVREERQAPPLAAKPIVQEERDQSPSLPVGIPQFTHAKNQVATGLRPSIDGLDWLKENKYQTVLHLREPREDDTADKKQVTKRGLNYLSLEVSPATLSPAIIKEFARIVGDNKSYPLFIYDKDGMLAGGLWYLYFRTVENDSDESARLKAGRLGLKDDQDSDHKAMWLAIQKYLSEQERK